MTLLFHKSTCLRFARQKNARILLTVLSVAFISRLASLFSSLSARYDLVGSACVPVKGKLILVISLLAIFATHVFKGKATLFQSTTN